MPIRKYEQLLKPLTINSMEVSNRVVMPPITTVLANWDGSVSEAMLAYMGRVSSSGAALFITEATAIHPDGMETPGMLGIYHDRFINGLNRLARTIQANGAKASIRVSGSERVFTGTVIHIATQGEFTPKTIQTKKERTNVVYAVKLSVDDQSGTLKPGMPADVVFHRGEADD
jgi:2,4-dienoyl-CoA reductase-like NADH-dependent reductase (Old Yellow Enzyme family)